MTDARGFHSRRSTGGGVSTFTEIRVIPCARGRVAWFRRVWIRAWAKWSVVCAGIRTRMALWERAWFR